ncbi:Nucleotide-diphospho-sugar transferase family-containing protein [Strongyloides ratti]|uniref:Nucleotide-diphospho-sugar transferase family-containing protein n=1 Tax=Strongyloides ratti TaxID=34506 RepID=A0A090KTC0_STRRB|nr:Nucleotide-diphospho-sugar transferase family-containing protein [Strongyloides ratti]CEF60725.1 Nucleotide-diphospho-sugar transferase family-containing protein [Strongyloides ratti]
MIQGSELCMEEDKLNIKNCKHNNHDRNIFNKNNIIKIQNNIYPTINTNIQFLLQSVSNELANIDEEFYDISSTKFINENDKKIIYVTFATTSTKMFLKNWLCNIYGLENGLTNATIFRKVLLISLDSDLCQEVINEYKLSCLYIPAGKESNKEIKTNDILRKWNIFVVDILKTILDQDINIFYFDTKNIWLKDPKMLLKNTTLIDDADIVLSNKDIIDHPYHFSSNPLLIYATKASKRFLAKLNFNLKILKNEELSTNIYIELINELCEIMYYGTVCREFSRNDICDMNYCNSSKSNNNKMNQTIIFNDFNILLNNSQKYTIMKRRNLWFLKPDYLNENITQCSLTKVKKVIE